MITQTSLTVIAGTRNVQMSQPTIQLWFCCTNCQCIGNSDVQCTYIHEAKAYSQTTYTHVKRWKMVKCNRILSNAGHSAMQDARKLYKAGKRQRTYTHTHTQEHIYMHIMCMYMQTSKNKQKEKTCIWSIDSTSHTI